MTMNNHYNNYNDVNNLYTYSNNYISYLNNSVIYLNNSINYLNNLMCIANQANQANQHKHAYLLNYDYDDFKKLSNINIYTLIKTSTHELYYGNIENPTNDTCAITHEKFSNCDEVTMIKECGHIFNSCAIKKWLLEHQTCPNCRHNILTNSNIISYLNPENNKTIFLYKSEFKFFLALHIERLLNSRQSNDENENNENNEYENYDNENYDNENNSLTYDLGLFLR